MAGLLAQAGLFLTQPALAIAGGVAVCIPIAIHLLTRLRRRPQAWAAMRFLIEVQRRHRHRLRFEQMLLLAVRCLIPLVLGLALGGLLLGGCAGRFGDLLRGAGGGPGRWVHLVIDDSLSTQVRDPSSGSRFDQLRQLALATIAGLEPADRVTVWRAAQPAGAVSASDGLDLAAARRAIKSIRPRYSRSDLIATLSLVDASLSQHKLRSDRAFVVLISDFAGDVLPADQPVPQPLRQFSDRAQLLVARPMPDAVNVQVAEVLPKQRIIFAAVNQRPPTVQVKVRLRRFVDHETRGLTRVELAAMDGRLSEPVAVTRLDHRWRAGQSDALIHASMPLIGLDAPVQGWKPTGSRQMLSIRVRIETGDGDRGANTLSADDQAWAVLGLRRHIRVGLIDQGHVESTDQDHRLTPGRWLRLALTPQQDHRFESVDNPNKAGMSFVELETIEAQGLNAEALQGVDVAMVLRPDLLDEQGWIRLRHLAHRGGLVWFFMPDNDSGPVWASGLSDHLDLDWQLSIEPAQSSGTDVQTSRPLAVDDPVPGLLHMLGADWRALVAPVRVSRRLDLTVENPPVSPDTVWLKTADARPVLVSSPVGSGRVVLWATAIEPGWTNLPTKPLFVPLLHETIRSVLSEIGPGRGPAVTCGQRPTLDPQWDGARELVLSAPQPKEPLSIRLQRSDFGSRATNVLELPGIYTAVPARVGGALAVNADPAGGDTRAVDPQRLSEWLSAMGKWRWLETANPAGMLAVPADTTGLGWPLLWAVLGLVLLEMCLARWFSHALLPGRTWLSRLMVRWRPVHHSVERSQYRP